MISLSLMSYKKNRLTYTHIHKVTDIDHVNTYKEFQSLSTVDCKLYFMCYPIHTLDSTADVPSK